MLSRKRVHQLGFMMFGLGFFGKLSRKRVHRLGFMMFGLVV
jgi:hypothetical protein